MLDKRTDSSSSVATDQTHAEGMTSTEVPPETSGDLPF
jgi:hypothetical protein